MSNFTLVIIDGEDITIHKHETFDESIQTMAEIRDEDHLKWIFYKNGEVFASRGIENV